MLALLALRTLIKQQGHHKRSEEIKIKNGDGGNVLCPLKSKKHNQSEVR